MGCRWVGGSGGWLRAATEIKALASTSRVGGALRVGRWSMGSRVGEGRPSRPALPQKEITARAPNQTAQVELPCCSAACLPCPPCWAPPPLPSLPAPPAHLSSPRMGKGSAFDMKAPSISGPSRTSTSLASLR